MYGLFHEFRYVERIQELAVELRVTLGQCHWFGEMSLLINMAEIEAGMHTILAAGTEQHPFSVR